MCAVSFKIVKVDESANIRKWIASHDSRERGHALEAKKSGSVSWLWFEWYISGGVGSGLKQVAVSR